jgi:hypothetical protein
MDGVFAALGNDGHFVGIDGALLNGALEGAGSDGAEIGRDEDIEGAVEDFGFSAAEEADGGLIEGEDQAGGIESDDGDAGVEDCGLEEVWGGVGVGGGGEGLWRGCRERLLGRSG